MCKVVTGEVYWNNFFLSVCVYEEQASEAEEKKIRTERAKSNHHDAIVLSVRLFLFH
jgi:hypothetical protein